jgi:DNA-binding NarL/FixJ family response regulator
MIRVLIADDHPIVREGLRQVISRADDMIVTGEASNGQEVLDAVAADACDVVVLDFSMPGKSGLDVVKDLRKDGRKHPILVLSMHPEGELAPRLLKAGASGYLTKESAPRDLVNAIRKIASGGTFISETLAERIASRMSTSGRAPHELLSDREFEVMVKLAGGATDYQVAEQLSISVKTVRTHRDRLMEKLGVRNEVEMTHYAITHKLLPPPAL